MSSPDGTDGRPAQEPQSGRVVPGGPPTPWQAESGRYQSAAGPGAAGYPAGANPPGNPYPPWQGSGPGAGGFAAGADPTNLYPQPPGWGQGNPAPGPGYQQPHDQQLHQARQSSGGSARSVNAEKVLGVAVAVLGGLNFLFGFLPEYTNSSTSGNLSVYAVGPGYVPILLLIAGLLALAAFVPGSERSRLAVAAVSVGGAVGAVISLGTTSPGTATLGVGLGAILLTIFGIVQAVIAIGGYVVGAGVSPRLRGPGPANANDTGPVGSRKADPLNASSGALAGQSAGAAWGAPQSSGWSGPPAAPARPAPGDGWSSGQQAYTGQAPSQQPYPGQPLSQQPYPGQSFTGSQFSDQPSAGPPIGYPSAAFQRSASQYSPQEPAPSSAAVGGSGPAEPPTGPQSVVGMETPRTAQPTSATDPAGQPAVSGLGAPPERQHDESQSDVVDLAKPQEQPPSTQ